MSDPTRLLLSADTTDLEKDLLRSWDAERPSSDARDRTLAALGLGGVGVAAGGAAASLAPKAAMGWMAVAKWLAVGLLALGVAGGTASLLVRHRAVGVVGGAASSRVVAHEVPSVTAEPLSTAPGSPEASASATNDESAHHAVARTLRPSSSSLADQVARLDRVHAALDSGETTRARRLVDAYEASYPSGALTQEAELLRIEALVREGNHVEAERAGKRFLAGYPKSPHAPRVRELLGYAPL